MPTQIDNIELSAQGNGEETVRNGNMGRKIRCPDYDLESQIMPKNRNISETVNDNRVDEESAQGNGNEKEEKPDYRELKEKKSEIKSLHKTAMGCINILSLLLLSLMGSYAFLMAHNMAKGAKVCFILAIWSFVALISSGVAAYMTTKIGPYSEQCIKFAPTFKKIVVVNYMMLGFGFLVGLFLIVKK